MSRILNACLLVTLLSCGQSTDLNHDGIADAQQTGRAPDSVSLIAPSNPIGTVSGVVVNSLQTGIEGVNVTLVLGQGTDATRKAITGADGSFVIKDVPGGAQGQVVMSKTGYSNARINVAVPAAGGQFPINDGNGNIGIVTLAQLTSTVKFKVFTSLGTVPKGAKAFLEVTATAFQTTAGAYGNPIGNFSGAAEVDDTGTLAFTNAPDPGELSRMTNPNFTVTIGALDVDMDGRTDFLGDSRNFSATGLFTQPDRTIVVNEARTGQPLQILGTNIESFTVGGSPPYRNAVKGSDPINIVFNQPITQVDTTRLIRVVQEDCQTAVAIMVTQRAANVLSIAPTAPWTLGNRYNIVVRATGLDSGTTRDFIGYFFAIDSTVPRPLGMTGSFQVRKAAGNMMSSALQPGDTLNVILDTPITYQGGPQARAIVNFDLNGDGNTGGALGFGEFNGTPNSGFTLAANEQTQANDPANGTFTCKTSGYASRWSITITVFPVMAPSIPANTQMRVIFPRDNTSSDTYQTAWGSPVAVDVSGTLTIVP